MSAAGCFGAPGCLAGALAHWNVSGTGLVVGIGDGRSASAIWISRGDGSDVHQDPRAVPASLRGLADLDIDPAAPERLRQGRH